MNSKHFDRLLAGMIVFIVVYVAGGLLYAVATEPRFREVAAGVAVLAIGVYVVGTGALRVLDRMEVPSND